MSMILVVVVFFLNLLTVYGIMAGCWLWLSLTVNAGPASKEIIPVLQPSSMSNLKSLFYVPLYVSYKRSENSGLHSALPHIRVVRSEEDKFHLQRIMRSDLQRIMRSDPGMVQPRYTSSEDDTDSLVDKRQAGGLGSHVRVIKSEDLTAPAHMRITRSQGNENWSPHVRVI